MKYKKIKDIIQYNKYCKIHEDLILTEDEEYEDELELLEVLIEDYDREVSSNRVSRLNPVELLRSLLANADYSQLEFSKKIDVSRQLISDILNYRRNISKEMVVKLSEYFSMSQVAFSREYVLDKNQISKQNNSIVDDVIPARNAVKSVRLIENGSIEVVLRKEIPTGKLIAEFKRRIKIVNVKQKTA